MQHYFLDQTAQEGFSALLRKQLMMPECRKMLTDGFESRLKPFAQWELRRLWGVALGLDLFSLFEGPECLVPSLLQGCRDETIVRVNTQELALGQLRLIAQPLQMLRVGMS